MRAAFPVLGCAELLETYVKPPEPGPDWVYCDCDGIELAMLCLTPAFNGWFELPTEYTEWRPGPLKPGEEGAGVVTVALCGST